MKRALIIIAPEGFQDLEFEGTKKGLADAGFDIVIGSTDQGSCHGKFGSVEEATVAMRDVSMEDYDRVAFIGGPGAHALADNVEAKDLVIAVVNAKKPLGAICVAPTILAKAGVLKGVQATVWDDGKGTQKNLLSSHGAKFVAGSVVTDGLIVTGNGPDAAQEFGRAFASL